MVDPQDELKCLPPFAAPAQLDAGVSVLTNEGILRLFRKTFPASYIFTTGAIQFARAIESKVACRGRAQGGMTNSNSAEFDGIKQSSTAPTVEVEDSADLSLHESIDTPEFLDLVCSWRDGIQDGALWSDIIGAITDYARNEVLAALASKPPAREAATAYVPLHVLEALRAGCKVATTLTTGKDADHTEAVQLVSDNH